MKRASTHKVSVVVAALVLVAACGRDPSHVTVSYALSAATCAHITDAAIGGSPIEGTFTSLSVAAMVSVVEFFRDAVPCTGANAGSADDSVVSLPLFVPSGHNRRLLLSVLGRRLGELGALLPDADFGDLPASAREPRVVFFQGVADIPTDAAKTGVMDLPLSPAITVAGRVEVGTAPRAARIRFFVPRTYCVPTGSGADAASQLDLVAAVDTSAGGHFVTSLPYRSDDGTCLTQTHGNELFGFAETATGEVALVAPGRSEAPGAGLEPGMLVRGLVVLPRTPNAGGAAVPLLTSVSRVHEGNRLVVYLAGFGLLRSVPFTFELRRDADGARIPIEMRLGQGSGGGDGAFGPFQSYAEFRRFGASLPYIARAIAFSGDAPLELSAGTYELTFGDATERHTLPLRVGAP